MGGGFSSKASCKTGDFFQVGENIQFRSSFVRTASGMLGRVGWATNTWRSLSAPHVAFVHRSLRSCLGFTENRFSLCRTVQGLRNGG